MVWSYASRQHRNFTARCPQILHSRFVLLHGKLNRKQQSGTLSMSSSEVALTIPGSLRIGTCALGISSLAPKTIIWAHLIAAFDALNMLCVQDPIKRVKGGRAYFGKQAVNSWINGKVKKDSVENSINGTEALPPGINTTIFKHNPKSQLACEWTLAVEDKDISSCISD